MPPAAPMQADYGYFLSTAASKEQRKNIIRAGEAEGLRFETQPEGNFYTLEVLLGRIHNQNDCGTFRNVIYRVSQSGARVLVLKARGWTGQCDPGVYDGLSKLLASYAHPK